MSALAEVAGRPQRQEDRAVEGEDQHERNASQNCVAAEQGPEAAGVVAARVDRDAVKQVRERDAPDERNADAADGVRPHPDAPPARRLALPAPLERDDTDDQEEEDEQQGEIE